MKRSEFGIEDWRKFMPALDHFHKSIVTEDIYTVSLQSISHSYREQDHVLIEAMRRTVETFCDKNSKPLPWEPDAPDFSAWSINMCEQYLKEQKCNWRTHNDYTEESRGGNFAIELQPPFNGGFGCEIGGPKVIDYQRAAEYVWKQVNK